MPVSITIHYFGLYRLADRTTIAAFARNLPYEWIEETLKETPLLPTRLYKGDIADARETLYATTDLQGRVFCIITDSICSPRVAISILHDLCVGAPGPPLAARFLEIQQKYSSIDDSLIEVKQKVQAVAEVMVDNVKQTLINEEKLVDIELASEDLLERAQEFQGRTKELRRITCWQKWKTRLFLGFLVISVLIILIVPAVCAK